MTRNTILLFCLAPLFWSCENISPSKTEPSDSSNIKTEAPDKEKTQQDTLITLLSTMNAGFLDCKADVYWKIIKRGKASIPLLIESLTDTTMTNVYDSCKHGKLNVGEVAHFALEEIADFPAFVVTHIQFHDFESGCWNFYDYLFDNRNKKNYQKLVRDFYNTNKFAFVRFTIQELNDCRNHYKIKGKYKLKE